MNTNIFHASLTKHLNDRENGELSVAPLIPSVLIAVALSAPGISTAQEISEHNFSGTKYKFFQEAVTSYRKVDEDDCLGDVSSDLLATASFFPEMNYGYILSRFDKLTIELQKKCNNILSADAIAAALSEIRSKIVLLNIPIRDVYASITQSNSLYFRFTPIGSEYEFKIDKFFESNNIENKDEDDDLDFEAILHIYKNNKKISAHYGDIQHLFTVMDEILCNISASPVDC